MSSVENAAYAIVHATRESAKNIAERTGIKHQVLVNKVSATCDRNHLTLAESVSIQQASGDHRILQAMAGELGYVCVPKPDTISDGDVTHAITTLCAEFGEYMRCVDSAMRDGRVTPNERRQLENKWADMIGKANHLQAVLASKTGRR